MRTMRMMEAKLCAALCALLLINLGSAAHGEDHAAVSNSTGSNISSAEPVLVATPDSVTHVVTSHQLNDSDTGSSFTGSSSDNATREEINSSVSAIPEKTNGTNITESNPLTTQPPSPPAVNTISTTHAPPNSTTTSPTQQDDTHALNITAITTPSTNTSVTQLNQPGTHSTAPATSLKPPQTETNATTAAVHSSSSSGSSTTQVSSTESASPTHAPSESQTEARQSSTTVQTASSSTRGSGHSGSPSQLNVSGDDTTMQHDSPTLDPLLAGLVSAFIITAVIITLLLFLKLRKRGNRPEFRRLQDLPMDDMMEDTPLSMYSY